LWQNSNDRQDNYNCHILGLALIAYNGVDVSKYYQDFVIIRDKAQPVADN